ncbi:hypothetical protein ACXGSF_06735 [Limosilactobacillus mucosae]
MSLSPNEKALVDVGLRHVSKAIESIEDAFAADNNGVGDHVAVVDLDLAISRLERAQEPLIDALKAIKKREEQNNG